MSMPRNLIAAVGAALALTTAAGAAGHAFADALPSEAAPSRVISVPRDKSLSFRLDEPATKIIVAQPDIAEVVATTDRSFYVRGVDVGSTNLLVYGPGGRLIQVIDVRVGYDAAALEADLNQALPNEHIHAQSLGEGILLTGSVSNPGAAIKATAIAQKFAAGDVTSMLRVGNTQVMLEVRILEANRSTARDLGVGVELGNQSFVFQQGSNVVGHPTVPPGGQFPLVGLLGSSQPIGALGILGAIGHTTINAQLAALETKGMLRTLARPNLIAMSGEKASFLAGGEFPFPVPNGINLVTIEFRPYGVKLDFTPTVQEDGKIKLVVAPEVSALDPTNTVRIDNVTVPALTVRKSSTTVELRDGESLAIGGLFQHTAQTDLSQVPGLGSIPILSALFRSTRYQRNETELLIIVTPHIVNQADIDHDKDRNLSGEEPGLANFMINGDALDKPMSHDLRGPIEPSAAGRPVARAAAAKAPTAKAPVVQASAAQASKAPVSVAPVSVASLSRAPLSVTQAALAPLPVVQTSATQVPVAQLRGEIQSPTSPLITAPTVPASGK
jgi:pilus assembly protein CpaC